jgi:sulfite reductase (NADPH) flavoprotein alpha-component
VGNRISVSAFEKVCPKLKKEKKEFAFELNKPELEQGNAFYAKVLEKRLLTSEKFKKRTLHFSLSMENFGTPFYPGDSFGVYTSNSRLLVDKLLKKTRVRRSAFRWFRRFAEIIKRSPGE